MTAKEKAIELINEFIDFTIYTLDKTLQNAIQCALICVKKIILSLKDTPNCPYTERKLIYWQEVKTEIENL